MEDYKIYKSKLILETVETQEKGFYLKDIKSVVNFARNSLNIGTYPEEVVFVICSNPSKQCINYFEISRGTILSSPIGIKELMKRVLATNANSFVLVHNHPCGDAIITDEDCEVTIAIAKAANLLQLEFNDHIVIGQDSHASVFVELSNRIEKRKQIEEEKINTEREKLNGN